MPTGVDYLCENEFCPGFGKKISIHGPFPIAKIDDVISVVKDDQCRNLTDKMGEGRKFAIIPIPNRSGLKPVGIRIQYYSPVTRTVIDRDLIWGQDDKIIRQLLNGADDSDDMTRRLGYSVKSILGMKEDGCLCPICMRKMVEYRWITSSGVKDWGDNHVGEGGEGKH